MVSMTNPETDPPETDTQDQDPYPVMPQGQTTSLDSISKIETPPKTTKLQKVLIIGADQIVGRALRKLDLPADEVAFSAPVATEGAELLKLDRLASFAPPIIPNGWFLWRPYGSCRLRFCLTCMILAAKD